jgi:hypothetical protein
MDKESILREWFYRLPNGYAEVPYTNAEMDILHEILEENGLNGSIFVNEVDQLDQAFIDAKPVEETQSDQTLEPGYDDLIIEELMRSGWYEDNPDLPTGTIPAALGKYPYDQGKTFKLDIKEKRDQEIFKLLFKIAPSKDVGNGEVSLYWLYQHSGVGAKDMRGKENPDLVVGPSEVPMEVKSFDSHNQRIGLGRWTKFKEVQRLLINTFAIASLTDTFKKGTVPKMNYSEVTFTAKPLTKAFEAMATFLNLDGLKDLIKTYPDIFGNIYKQCQYVIDTLELDLKDILDEPKKGAAALLVRLVSEKFYLKPNMERPIGYIASILKGNPLDIQIFCIDLDALKLVDPNVIADNVGINGSSIDVNYSIIFPLTGKPN